MEETAKHTPQIGKSYGYSLIKEYIDAYGLEEKEYGEFLVGEHFIVLRDPSKSGKPDDVFMTFVLVGYTTQGQYRLVYWAGE